MDTLSHYIKGEMCNYTENLKALLCQPDFLCACVEGGNDENFKHPAFPQRAAKILENQKIQLSWCFRATRAIYVQCVQNLNTQKKDD